VVVPANYNSPGQIVIGGHADALDRALAGLASRGVKKAVKLAGQRSFAHAADAWCCDAVGRVHADPGLESAAIALSSRTRMLARMRSVEAIRDALARQLYLPVRWTECVQALAAGGATRLVECGPGKVLSGLAKRIDKSLDARSLAMPVDFDATLAA
jgi:[acyl-carrier-protein] S-malonyltransferase